MLQTFMYDLIGAMTYTGMQVPRAGELPEIVFHDSRQNFPGETLERAIGVAKDFFGEEPNIIFVLLPDTGKPQKRFPFPFI